MNEIISPPLHIIDKALLFHESKDPFSLPPDNKLFQARDEQINREKERHRKMIKQSIINRSFSTSSPTNNKSRRGCRSSIENKDCGVGISPPIAEHQQRQQMDEFVGQKREIFLVQLLIDRKNKEIQRIQNLRKTEKKNIAEEEAKIAEVSNQYKMTTNQIDAELSREKKNMEAAIKQRTRFQKELKQKTMYVDAITSENGHNSDTSSTFQNYKRFLENLTPHGMTTFQFFSSPHVLLDEIEKVENENLFLIQHCHELEYEQETVTSAVRSDIKKTTAESGDLLSAMSKLKTVEVFQIAEERGPENDSCEMEINKLAKIVTNTYEECFNETADFNSLTRLERIENELETMYREMTNIDKEFIKIKQAEKDKKRREEQRRAKAEELQKEQVRKHKQALLRAQMPIKRKTGRPVQERTLPIKLNRSTIDEKQKLIEEQAQDIFLFGDIEF